MKEAPSAKPVRKVQTFLSFASYLLHRTFFYPFSAPSVLHWPTSLLTKCHQKAKSENTPSRIIVRRRSLAGRVFVLVSVCGYRFLGPPRNGRKR
jgi:hypothetical protein